MKAVISQWCGLFVLGIMTLSQSLRFRHVDPSVMERAVGKSRILITEDKDFGQLVYATMQRTGGVILFVSPRVRVGVLPRQMWNWSEGVAKISSHNYIL